MFLTIWLIGICLLFLWLFWLGKKKKPHSYPLSAPEPEFPKYIEWPIAILVLVIAIWLELSWAEFGVMIGTLAFVVSVILDERPSLKAGIGCLLISLLLFFIAYLFTGMKLDMLVKWMMEDDPTWLLGYATCFGTIAILAIISSAALPKSASGTPTSLLHKRFK